MGKQSKRKRQKGLRNRPSPSLAQHDTSPHNPSKENAILAKIRHGDPRVRHAALVALSSTVYDSSSLSRRRVAKASSSEIAASDPALLRALSERLLDPDIPCAIIAAGCLSNHVSFSAPQFSDEDGKKAGTDGDELEVLSQVMMPILMQRIQLTHETCVTLGKRLLEAKSQTLSPAPVAAKKSSPIDKISASAIEQWNLQSLSLQTLAGLIENSPLAVKRMSDSTLSLLLKVINCSVECINRQLVSFTKEEGQHKTSPILEAASSAARALHSLLDENVQIISNIPKVSASAPSSAEAPTIIALVHELAELAANGKMTNTTRLHACGAILSLRKVLVVDRENVPGNLNAEDEQICNVLQSCSTDVVIPTLHSLFSVNPNANNDAADGASPKALVHRMIQLSQILSSQKQDEAMESAIVQEINARKEPARLIARRQKEMKKAKEEGKEGRDENVTKSTQEDGMEMEDENKTPKEDCATMVVEDDTSRDNDNNNDETADPKDELDAVLYSWRELCGSHKLALELMANLCSGPGDEDDEDEEDMKMNYGDEDNEYMWDSDDEAKLMDATTGSSAAMPLGAKSSASPMDRCIYTSIASHQLAEQMLLFFKNWILFLPSLLSEGQQCPELVVEDVEELLSTCALCIGNMIACEIPTWTSPALKEATSALCPSAIVHNGAELVWWNLVSLLTAAEHAPCNIRNIVLCHVSSVMLSLLRHHTNSRTLLDAPTLDVLFVLLTSDSAKKVQENKNIDSSIRMQCNVIAMLGVLCSGPHSAVVNARVCAALTEKLRSALPSSGQSHNSIESLKQTVILLNESYNVLMDLYGGDDANDDVFQQQDVLGHFTRTLPEFKRSIKKVSSSTEKHDEDVDVWNETALNVSRFIRFKREG
ncbi:hypothetical protein HJC23_004765 [Cyclotella cryptica]|uniref:SYO1-like TPR repeats domain-containing protein n=1 Tax=Cyclotella cryptica TaxID=29204 RepID=A0ABD3PCN7_9STRA